MLKLSIFLQDFATRGKLAVQNMVQKVGFFGILACASVSNILEKKSFLSHISDYFPDNSEILTQNCEM